MNSVPLLPFFINKSMCVDQVEHNSHVMAIAIFMLVDKGERKVWHDPTLRSCQGAGKTASGAQSCN